MNPIQSITALKNVDIYLIDQLLRAQLTADLKTLDAGCGSGRNLLALNELGFNIEGFDPNAALITQLQQDFPGLTEQLYIASIENFETKIIYDYIICNAVLHFAKSHAHFELMFEKLMNLLKPRGTLFIRMTSNFANRTDFNPNKKGLAALPDGSNRYLLTEQMLEKMVQKYQLKFKDPLKTVNVNNLRCMSTLVLTK